MKIFFIFLIFFLAVSLKAQISEKEGILEYRKKKLAKLFASDVKHTPNTSYQNYLLQRKNTPFKLSWKIIEPVSIKSLKQASVDISNYLIVIDELLYPKIAYWVDRYISDIQNAYNCRVVILKVSSSIKPEELKEQIKNENNSNPLSGAFFIGDIPTAFYEVKNDFEEYGYANWPCDLFMMDLDGNWSDNDGNGIYDSHTGNNKPEIFIGRLIPSIGDLLPNIVEAYKKYFDKNHEYWEGSMVINKKKSLSYIDKDWVESMLDFGLDNLYGASNHETITPNTNSDIFGGNDYLQRLENENYEFIYLAAHSYYYSHVFSVIDDVEASDIYQRSMKAISYNLYCCSALNWTLGNKSIISYLGGAYIFNDGGKSLNVVGSTKTGSLYNCWMYYETLSKGECVGNALKTWWETLGNEHSINDVYWFYGISILGDPLVSLYGSNEQGPTANPIINKPCDRINIFPNPTSDILKIKAKNIISIEIINSYGQVIQNIPVNNRKEEIDLSLQLKGVYYARVTTKEGTVVKKIIIK